MKQIILVIIALSLISCTSTGKITHGQPSENTYISNDARFELTLPEGWYSTISPPSANFEQNLASKLKRDRELGYIVKDNGTAFIIIETHWLTWAGKPIIPVDITWDKTGPERLKKSCNYLMSNEKKNIEPGNIFNYECYALPKSNMCLFDNPCYESTKTIFNSDTKLIEKVYIIGDVPPNPIPPDAHGWRVHFTLSSPSDTYQKNMEVFEKIIKSLRKV